jgi:predicted nuclease of predicted toxin-antitoxin system
MSVHGNASGATLPWRSENFPVKLVALLREMGHDVLTSREAGNANQRIPDADVLEFAAKSGRILLTLNRRDFIALHQKMPQHASLIVCMQNPNLRQQSEQIDRLIQETGNLAGKLVRVNREQK